MLLKRSGLTITITQGSYKGGSVIVIGFGSLSYTLHDFYDGLTHLKPHGRAEGKRPP